MVVTRRRIQGEVALLLFGLLVMARELNIARYGWAAVFGIASLGWICLLAIHLYYWRQYDRPQRRLDAKRIGNEQTRTDTAGFKPGLNPEI